jgi:hypothetical protein
LSRFDLINFFVGKELVLHLVSVNIREVVEHIIAKVRCNFLVLFEASVLLLALIERVVSAQCLSLTLRVLL